ncbi:DUF3887 domain-containing protein [Humidisolicoccus flavus]|uniref:DUF3887 domain-containing protein n=1 Tax=Humidisolicoccus flavus TaxID=3111414 RepID=UPI00324C5918
MQDRLTDAIRALQTRTQELLAVQVLHSDDQWSSAIERAMEIQASADDVVHTVVQQARNDGATWQVIGDALGVSRQAAFQRFGKPIDPRTGEPMNTTPLAGASDLASSVISDLSGAQWPKVTEHFDATMRAGLSEDMLAAAWAQIIGLAGAFESHGEPAAMRAGDVTITNTPLSFEAGEYIARIVFRDDTSIAGLHILEAHAS